MKLIINILLKNRCDPKICESFAKAPRPDKLGGHPLQKFGKGKVDKRISRTSFAQSCLHELPVTTVSPVFFKIMVVQISWQNLSQMGANFDPYLSISSPKTREISPHRQGAGTFWRKMATLPGDAAWDGTMFYLVRGTNIQTWVWVRRERLEWVLIFTPHHHVNRGWDPFFSDQQMGDFPARHVWLPVPLLFSITFTSSVITIDNFSKGKLQYLNQPTLRFAQYLDGTLVVP